MPSTTANYSLIITFADTDLGSVFINAFDTNMGLLDAALLALEEKAKGYSNLAAFPVTGVIDRIYIAKDTFIPYIWDVATTAYVAIGGGGGGGITVSETAPTDPDDGDLWWKSDEGVLLIYYNDGTSSQWVDASPVSPALHYTETLAVVTWVGSAAPYSYTITKSGIKATDKPMVDFIASDTYTTALLEEAAWLNVYKVTSAVDTITLYAHEKPTVALDINIEVIR